MQELFDHVYPTDTACYEEHPRSTITKPITVCVNPIGSGVTMDIDIDYCGYKKKYNKMVRDTIKTVTEIVSCSTDYIPTKAYYPLLACLNTICKCDNYNCSDASEDALQNCMQNYAINTEGNTNISYPANSDPVTKRITVFHPEEILEERTVTVIVVFCNMSISSCPLLPG